MQKDIEILAKFIATYCENRHKTSINKLNFKDETLHLNISLCSECNDIFKYSLSKLKNCPHKIKPKCRNCKEPCYEKFYWKRVAKIMRYSGVKLGFLKIKNFLKIKK